MATAPASANRRRRNADLDQAMGQLRSMFLLLIIFSLAINLLILASPIYMLQVYDRVLSSGRIETLVMLTVIAGAAMLALGVLDAIRASIMARAGAWLTNRLSGTIISSGVRARLLGDSAGAQPLRDLAQVQNFLTSQGLMALFDAPWAIIFLALIWALHPTLGTFATGACALLIILGLINEMLSRKAIQTSNTAQIAAIQHAEATIRNAEVVRSMGMLPALLERWKTANDAYVQSSRTAGERTATMVGLTKFARMFVQSATLGLGAYLMLAGEVTGGAMIASSILLGRALAPVEIIMGSWRNVSAARIAYGRLRARLDAVPAEPPRTRLPEPTGNVLLDHVSYSVPGTSRPVIDNVSFAMVPGEAVAVIGPSASGKSTLCRLIAGIVTPTAGVVRFDGSELRHWDPQQLGRYLGYLPQDVELFMGSVRDNIARMGDGRDDDVVRAALLAHAHDMIQRLPQGYETPIGDGGSRLSGGQRQRIGLARAVFGAPKMIVLDEPNANLDQAGEMALAAAVRQLKELGCSLLIVGHRPSTLAQADKILFLRDGRVQIFGPRDEVLGKLRRAIAGSNGEAEGPRDAEIAAESKRFSELTDAATS
jgi:PrtD family type I secretion system ABC transporter